MDLAVSALTIAFLAIPGLLFRRFYYSGEFSTASFRQSSVEAIGLSLPFSILIHSFGWLIAGWFGVGPDTNTLSALLNTEEGNTLRSALERLNSNYLTTFTYHMLAALTGVFLGIAARNIVRIYRWDRKLLLFRFPNNWHYLLSGEAMDFKPGSTLGEKVGAVFVDALINTHEGSVIYSGLLDHYVLSRDGGLDMIVLTEAIRRYLKNDPEVDSKGNGGEKEIDPEHNQKDIQEIRLPLEEQSSKAKVASEESIYYVLPGDMLCMPYSQIINLHLTYYKVDRNDKIE
jgi:hypothetical protein